MAKNKNKVVKEETPIVKSAPVTVPLPPKTNMDDISMFSESELASHIQAATRYATAQGSSNEEMRYFQDELAYLYREVQLRRARQSLHTKYLASIGELVPENEDNYPPADLDNTAFMRYIGVL